MARFIGFLNRGNRRIVKNSSKKSGIESGILGRHSGCQIQCHVKSTGEEVLSVFLSNGTIYGRKGTATGRLITTVDGRIEYIATKKELIKE